MKLFGLAWAYRLLFPLTALAFALTTAGLAAVAGGIGLLLLLVFVPLLRAQAALERLVSGAVLGTRIEAWYRPRRRGGPFALLTGWATDQARWRDYLMAFVSIIAGFVLVSLSDLFLLAGLFYLCFPLLIGTTPRGVFDLNLGIWEIDTVREAFATWVFAGLGFLIWWFVEPPLLRARAAMARAILSPSRAELERRVEEVSRSRAESIDYSAAELRRIERDLHDGAQARLVSLGMSLGLAEDLLRTDPEAAARLLVEARQATTSALGDLRTVVRGIHPPVLADRGLGGAVQALALEIALPVQVTVDLPGRPPAPVESAAYFAVAECLANTMKHAHARAAWIWLEYRLGRLHVRVVDDGHGGADPEQGTGLAGVRRRLAAFDGTMDVDSPPGGPTIVTLELPCELSSVKT
jgi:signal transduction histidine kinase